MMVYADESYYANTYGGSVVPADSLTQALTIASEVVDALTFNRIADIGMDALTVYQQTQIKRACCIIAEDVHAGGGLNPGAAVTGGFSLGDFSIQAPTGVTNVCGVAVSGRALSALRASGMMYTGVR